MVDCAHGAAYHTAPEVFHELGAEVVTIGTQPNGLNINYEVVPRPYRLYQAVLGKGRFRHRIRDGDADRRPLRGR